MRKVLIVIAFINVGAILHSILEHYHPTRVTYSEGWWLVQIALCLLYLIAGGILISNDKLVEMIEEEEEERIVMVDGKEYVRVYNAYVEDCHFYEGEEADGRYTDILIPKDEI
jgi:hypothetical protein